MRKQRKLIQTLRSVAVVGGVLMMSNLVMAQAPATGTPAPTEILTAMPTTVAAAQPIVHNWKLKKLDGEINLLVNPDGTWNFSGHFSNKKPGDNFSVTFALKSNTGAVYLFHYIGDASSGVSFSKQGQSLILKDDYATFSHHEWSGVYTFHLNGAGRRARYEAMEKKREEIRRAEEEARKRHDEKMVAEKKEEEKQEAQAEVRWEEQYANEHPAGGGGGGTSVAGVASTISSVVSSVGSVVGTVAALF
ncbi:MAG: hypothetical protein WBY53_14610 [Acidobacteriaceae bacterium]